MAALFTLSLLILTMFTSTMTAMQSVGTSSWCVARSDASNQALQTALDYACWAGADCTPIQPDGLCYLPNTMQAHASYAFNSFYQRKGMAPGSCDFAGTATIAKTDPSYGSCMYPSSYSSAGGTAPGSPTPTMTPPSTTSTGIPNTPTMPNPTTTTDNGGITGVNPIGMGPPMPNIDDESKASESIVNVFLVTISFLIISLFT